MGVMNLNCSMVKPCCPACGVSCQGVGAGRCDKPWPGHAQYIEDTFLCTLPWVVGQGAGGWGAWPASELRVVEYLLPRVSGRRGDGMTAQQLKESIEPEATTDDEKYEVVVEKVGCKKK
eukprot:576683-Pelagomonas_calceolata.AAC.3